MYTTALLAAFATAALAEVHEIRAGPGNVFNPDRITAAPGDYVAFVFEPVHNVASSSHNQPCVRNETFGFWSTMPDFDGGEAAQRFVVQINNTDPVWFYCAVQGHCQDGMVGVINEPSSGDTLTEYRNGATSASRATYPADSGPIGGQLLDAAAVSSLAGGSPTPAPSATSPAGTTPSSPESSAAAETSASPVESSAAQVSSAISSAVSSAESSAAESSASDQSTPAPTSSAPTSATGGANPPASTGAAAEYPQAVGSSTVLALIAGVAAWFL